MKHTHKSFNWHVHIPKHKSHCVLALLLIMCAIIVVLPQLHSLQMFPDFYYNNLPIASEGDADRDGIPDYLDVIPIEVERTSNVVEITPLPIVHSS